MRKADLKPGVLIVNYKGGNIFKVHNILNEDDKDVVWLVDTVTEKVSQQGYNTVLKNYKIAESNKVEEDSIIEEEVVNTSNENDKIESKEDKFKELEGLEPEVITVPEDKERPNLEAIFSKNKEMELNGGNKMKKDVKKKKVSKGVKEGKEVKASKKTKASKKEVKADTVDKAVKPKASKKEVRDDVTTLQEILDELIDEKKIPEMDSKKARRLIRSRCADLKSLTVDGTKWEFSEENLEEATKMIQANLGK